MGEAKTAGSRQRAAMVAIIAFSAVTGWSVRSWAAGPPWLEWSAPPGCPESAYIERRVSEWVGGPLVDYGDLFVRTTLGRSNEQWDVGVVITREGQTGERRVVVSSCAAAADFVAIAVALAVDPNLSERLGSDSPPEAEGSRRGSAFAEDSATPPASVGTAPSNDGGGATRRSAKRGARRGKPDDTRSSPRFHEDGPGMPWQAHVTLWGEDAWQTLPRPTAGVGLAVGVDHGRWSLALGGRRLLPVTQSPERAISPIEFSLLGVRSALGYHLFRPPVQVAPLVAVERGTILAHQKGSTADRVTEPWWLFGCGAGVFVQLSARITLTGEVELGVPLTRPTFVLSDRSEVYHVRPGGRGLLGMRFFFDSR